jgi:hypothetical protein
MEKRIKLIEKKTRRKRKNVTVKKRGKKKAYTNFMG